MLAAAWRAGCAKRASAIPIRQANAARYVWRCRKVSDGRQP